MAFLFKRNPKTPPELVRALNEQVVKIDTTSDKRKIQDEISRYLSSIKIILHGDEDNDPQPDQIAQLAHEVYQTDVLYYLISNLQHLEFDSRKDVATLFTTLLRRQIGSRSPTVDYLVSKPNIINLLLKGPEVPDVCLITGGILRDCLKIETLTNVVLHDPIIWKYFEFSQRGTFENMTDSFQTLNDTFTIHKKLVADWFNLYSTEFILHLNKLIASTNYVTKRQSIKLLSLLILTRQNNRFMLEYVTNPENLKLIMISLSDKSKNLQLESFNVFKVFVANPKKTKSVLDILIKNREKLLLFLENFNFNEKKDDSNFHDEKEFVIQQIEDLPRIVSSSSAVNLANSGTVNSN
ncbi:Calcium-binding protein [Wickerhamomyces ciferrii]|uniref:Calcium-binding protein n=1 Tax=Wickerhamomyces ciferrii (strain ATCC 14091 / BCRC 22168 / CBS 111 / JCM 3599 / NBRC 0793 / NRRL Y-1031 F-60-10) TaxID=1206466 RepID=K0KMD7_WICCF|nr:Calcium-binding protein [Wickerhamomyces ciferrii]CCH42544.1 Calcium-binding protein [Wickerhamomyces ciferrii]